MSGKHPLTDVCAKILYYCIFLRHAMLQLHGAIYRPDSFVLMLHYCANLKAIRCESTSLNRIIADKSHRVIVALEYQDQKIVITSTHCFIPTKELHGL